MSKNITNTEGELVDPVLIDPTIISNGHTLTIPNNGVNASFFMSGLGSSAVYNQGTSNTTAVPITTTFGKVTMFAIVGVSSTTLFNLTGSLIKSTTNVVILTTASVNNVSTTNFLPISIDVGTPSTGTVQLTVTNPDFTFTSTGKVSFYYMLM